MIGEHDILSFNYLKKQAFLGSFQGMRYRLKAAGEGDEAVLEAIIWPEPFILEHTDEELSEKKEFPFSEEGREEAIAWLNERYASRKEFWITQLGKL